MGDGNSINYWAVFHLTLKWCSSGSAGACEARGARALVIIRNARLSTDDVNLQCSWHRLAVKRDAQLVPSAHAAGGLSLVAPQVVNFCDPTDVNRWVWGDV